MVLTLKETIAGETRYTIYSANTGDSRTILLNPENDVVKRLSYDHKATDTSEVARLRRAGGTVFNGRVYG